MAKDDRPTRPGRVVVLGLGRFGVSLALELIRRGTEVLGIDSDSRVVQRLSDDTTAVLVDLGIPNIWAKAISRRHGRILERIGAHHVVLPEHEMGERVAHLVTGRMMDYIEFEDDFAMVKTVPPRDILGRPLSESRVRSRDGITVVGVKRPGEAFTYAVQDTVVHAGDLVIVSGRINDVEAFANRT